MLLGVSFRKLGYGFGDHVQQEEECFEVLIWKMCEDKVAGNVFCMRYWGSLWDDVAHKVALLEDLNVHLSIAGGTFRAFCDLAGLDFDSRHALNLYLQKQEINEKFMKFLGKDFEEFRALAGADELYEIIKY